MKTFDSLAQQILEDVGIQQTTTQPTGARPLVQPTTQPTAQQPATQTTGAPQQAQPVQQAQPTQQANTIFQGLQFDNPQRAIEALNAGFKAHSGNPGFSNLFANLAFDPKKGFTYVNPQQ